MNSTADPLHVTLNPWPKFFELPPSGALELRQTTDSRTYFEVDVDDRGLWVFGAPGGVAALSLLDGGPELLPPLAPPNYRTEDNLPGWPGRTAELVGASAADSVGMYVGDERGHADRVLVTRADQSETRHPLPAVGAAEVWTVATGVLGQPPTLEIRPDEVCLIGARVEVSAELWDPGWMPTGRRRAGPAS